MELWTAHWYVTSPIGDRGKAGIFTLWVMEQDGAISSVTSNEERVWRFVAFSSWQSLFNHLYHLGLIIRTVSHTVFDHPWHS